MNHHPDCPELPGPAPSPIGPPVRFCPPAGLAAVKNEVSAPAIPTLVSDPREIEPALMESTVAKATAFIQFVDSLADDMEKFLATCPVESREGLVASFNKLRNGTREVRRTKFVGEVSIDVHSRLQELMCYGGSKKAFHTLEPPLDDTPFMKGAMGSGNSTTCRVVVPLMVAKIFFQNADVDRYITQQAAVSVPARMLEGVPVYWCQDGQCKEKRVTDFDSEWAQFRMFELPLNYEATMQRYSLNALPKPEDKPRQEIIRGYLAAWLSLLVQEKRRQMHTRAAEAWPFTLPWQCSGLEYMPVVLWLKKGARVQARRVSPKAARVQKRRVSPKAARVQKRRVGL